MSRTKRQLINQASRANWFSPGMVVAAVLVAVMHTLGVDLTTWWVWLVAIGVSIIVDALLGIRANDVIQVKRTTEYERGVQEDDDGVV